MTPLIINKNENHLTLSRIYSFVFKYLENNKFIMVNKDGLVRSLLIDETDVSDIIFDLIMTENFSLVALPMNDRSVEEYKSLIRSNKLKYDINKYELIEEG